MATSGSIDYAPTAQELIENAAALIGAWDGSSMDADDLERGRRALNQLCKGLQARGAAVARRTEGTITPVAGQAAYTLSPFCVMVYDLRRKVTADYEYKIDRISYEEYEDLPNKTAQGAAASWAFQRNRTSAVVYIWPTPSAGIVSAGETWGYTYQRVIEDVDTVANEVDVAPEWIDALTYELAGRLADVFPPSNDPGRIQRVLARAAELMETAMAQDNADSVFFWPRTR